MSDYKTELPLNCPPQDATINLEFEAYRVTTNGLIDKNTFQSQAQMFPENERYRNVCSSHAVSLWNTERQAFRTCMCLQDNGNESLNEITKIRIKPHIGMHLKKKGHNLLWVFRDVDVDASIEIVETKKYEDIKNE